MNFDLENFSSFSGWERLVETGMAFGTNLVAALAIFFVGRWIASRLVILMKAALTRAKVDRTLVSFLGNVANIGLLILIIIAALGKLGIPTTSVTALIGGAGLAVALSLKDQLSNFAAGALIILFRPFKVGDYIKVNGFEASRSLHLHQPRAWLRHSPYLRATQILKPRCRVCAVRTHAFFGVKPLFQTFRRPQTSSENLLV